MASASDSTPASSVPQLEPLNVSTLFSTKGLVALITGGGTGLGLIMARALAEAGAEKVYIAGRRLNKLQDAAASIEASLARSRSPADAEAAAKTGPVVVPVECDVSSKESLAAVARHIEAESGFLNVVMCNAGVNGPLTPADNDASASLEQWREQQLAVDVDSYQDTFKINTTAVWFTAVTFLSLLDAGNRRGNVEQTSQVIVTSSLAAFNRKAPAGWAYGQSKSAATLATKQLAVLLPKWGIRANCIAPGLFPSEMAANFLSGLDGYSPDQSFIPVSKSIVPLGRIGEEKDMAGTILYVVSRAGAYLNGNIVLLDGGRLGTFPSTY